MTIAGDLAAAALAGFAGALAHPAVAPLVLAAGLLLRRPARLRLVAALVACASQLPEVGPGDLAVAAALMLGAAVAGLALAELWLLIILPAARWTRRTVRVACRRCAALAMALADAFRDRSP